MVAPEYRLIYEIKLPLRFRTNIWQALGKLMIFLYVYSAWSVSSHSVSGKEDRQNQQSHPKYILSLICFYLSTHVELLTSLNIYLPLCKFISLICKWNNQHTEPESLEELPFCHSFHTNLYKRYSIFCPFPRLCIMVWAFESLYQVSILMSTQYIQPFLFYTILLTHHDLATLSSVSFLPIKI